MKNETELKTHEEQDSIKISKGMNGRYSYEAKLYYNSEKRNYDEVIQQLQKIDSELKAKFGDEAE